MWVGYDAKMAASDAILQQCDDKKLQKRIIAENLTFENIIKMGVAIEQGNTKVNRMHKGTRKTKSPRKTESPSWRRKSESCRQTQREGKYGLLGQPSAAHVPELLTHQGSAQV